MNTQAQSVPQITIDIDHKMNAVAKSNLEMRACDMAAAQFHRFGILILNEVLLEAGKWPVAEQRQAIAMDVLSVMVRGFFSACQGMFSTQTAIITHIHSDEVLQVSISTLDMRIKMIQITICYQKNAADAPEVETSADQD